MEFHSWQGADMYWFVVSSCTVGEETNAFHSPNWIRWKRTGASAFAVESGYIREIVELLLERLVDGA